MDLQKLQPGHAAIDGKVERVGGVDDDIDEQDDVTDKVVVEEFNNTMNKAIF